MTKTTQTDRIEQSLIDQLKLGEFGCPEVTVGFGGNERVDFMLINTKNVVKCYEIKVSKADFYSQAHHSFVGNYNYYAMPSNLYEQIKEDIPSYVSVTTGSNVLKKAHYVELSEDLYVLMMSMIRSMNRDVSKFRQDFDIYQEGGYKRQLNKMARQYKQNERELERNRKYLRAIKNSLKRNRDVERSVRLLEELEQLE